ncbi:MAG: glycosyltransferase, partial [Spirochaetia bacterium]|nr:glycosyltransferase [Spirochaetia bacterium]
MQHKENNLLILIHSLRGGGAGRVCVFLANGLASRGWDVTVAVNLPEGQRWLEKFDSRVTVEQLGSRHARRALFPLVKLVRSMRPTVVLSFNYQLAVLLPFVRSLSGIPFKAVGRTVVALSEAARYRSFWQRKIVMPFVRRRYRHLDLVIAQAEAMRQDLLHRFSLRDDQLVVINNPSEIPDKAEQQESEMVQDTRPPRLLYLGRFKPQKQPRLLLDLVEKLRGREGFEDARLIAAGEGPLLEQFMKELRARGLEDAVDYRGYSDDIEALFAEADLTVLVSRYEGFPNVLVESIARGVPVLSFDCPSGPADIILEGVNGRLVAMNDMESLVAAAAELLVSLPPQQQVRDTALRF